MRRASLLCWSTLSVLTALACGGGGVPTDGSTSSGGGATSPSSFAAMPAPPRVERTYYAGVDPMKSSYSRGEFLVALDYRNEGWGNYGFLYDTGARVWIVEGDKVMGGPFAEDGPEVQRVTAIWTAFEKDRHAGVMQGIAAMPHGCLDGCAFEIYDGNGNYQGIEIQY